MVHYHHGDGTALDTAQMVTKVQQASRHAETLGLGSDGIIVHILHPVLDELLKRYGREAGGKLVAEFIASFDSIDPPISDGKGRAPLGQEPLW